MSFYRSMTFILLVMIALPVHTSANEYTIGLILQGNTVVERDDAPAIEIALNIFKEELAGSLGDQLTDEFGFRPPTIRFNVRRGPTKKDSQPIDVARDVVKSTSVATITLWDSATVLDVRKVFDDNNMVLIAPIGSDPKITQGSHYIFSLMYSNKWQGAVIAEYVYRIMKKRKVAIFHEDDVYGKSLTLNFVNQAKAIGYSPALVMPVSSSRNSSEPGSVKIAAEDLHDVDAIVVFTYQDLGLSIVRDIRKMGLMIPAIGSDGLVTGSLCERVMQMEHSLNLQDVHLMVASPFFYELAPLKAYDFKLLFMDKVKDGYAKGRVRVTDEVPAKPPAYAGLFVDAALLITRGIMRSIASGKTDVKDVRNGVRKYLHSLNAPQNAVEGMSGLLYFDKHNNVPRPVLFGWLRNNSVQPAYVQLWAAQQDQGDGHLDDEKIPEHEVLGVPLKKVHVVYTGMDVYRINNVDLESQSFDAELFVWFKWKGPDNLVIDRKTIFLWNSIYSIDDQVVILDRDLGDDLKYACFRIKSGFLADYDLHQYPFDVQTIRFQLSFPNLGTDDVLLTVDGTDLVARDRFKVYPKEYQPVGKVRHASGTRRLASDLGNPELPNTGAAGIDFSVHEMRVKLKRNLFPYLQRLFLPLFILTGIALAVYWIPIKHFEVRIGSLLTALLGALVFHMAKDESLPNVGYLSLADQYFVFAYVLMAVSIIVIISVEWIAAMQSFQRARRVNAACRYLVTVGAAIVFFRLSYVIMGMTKTKAILLCMAIALIGLVWEYLVHRTARRAKRRSLQAVSDEEQQLQSQTVAENR